MTGTNTARLRAVLTAALAAATVAVIGGTLTDLGPWYHGLAKPAWQPPGAAFGIIWTIIFALTAISGSLAWQKAPSPATREWILGLFALNGFLNIFWSLLFFRLRHPDWALFEVLALWTSVALLMAFTARLSWAACLMLAPYLCWVSVAGALNYEIVRLNSPF